MMVGNPLLGNLLDDELSLEGKLYKNAKDLVPVYVLLTDTKTGFSKLSARITKEQYNHVSLMLDTSFEMIYTFALKTTHNNHKGGFKLENKSILNGAHYQLYKVMVPAQVYKNVGVWLSKMVSSPEATRYNHKSLLNFILKRDIFKSKDMLKMICSEFVYMVLKESGHDLFRDNPVHSISPTDLVKGHGIEFVSEGVIKNEFSKESGSMEFFKFGKKKISALKEALSKPKIIVKYRDLKSFISKIAREYESILFKYTSVNSAQDVKKILQRNSDLSFKYPKDINFAKLVEYLIYMNHDVNAVDWILPNDVQDMEQYTPDDIVEKTEHFIVSVKGSELVVHQKFEVDSDDWERVRKSLIIKTSNDFLAFTKKHYESIDDIDTIQIDNIGIKLDYDSVFDVDDPHDLIKKYPEFIFGKDDGAGNYTAVISSGRELVMVDWDHETAYVTFK